MQTKKYKSACSGAVVLRPPCIAPCIHMFEAGAEILGRLHHVVDHEHYMPLTSEMLIWFGIYVKESIHS